MIIIKHLKNSIHTGLVVCKLNYKKFNLIDFIKIFIIRFFFAFPIIRNIRKLRNINDKEVLNEENDDQNNFFENDLDVKEILQNLDTKGYYDKLKLPKSSVEKLIDEINDKNCFVDSKGLYKDDMETSNNLKFQNLGDISKITKEKKIEHCVIKFKNNSTFLNEIALSKNLINIVSSYLNSENITCKIQCFISNPFLSSKEERKKNAQFFHYDCDYKKFLKIFIYLCDVDDNNGPHVFIENTHKNKKLKHILAERIDDKEVLESYGKNTQKKFLKDTGTLIIEDTFGLHKGETPKKESRHMLVIEYGVGESILKNDNYFYV